MVPLRHRLGQNGPGGTHTQPDLSRDPAYSFAEGARHLRLSPATLRSWFLGRPYPTARGTSHFKPVLELACKKPPTLSFANLIEAHVLRSLRTEHGIPLPMVRKALAYAEHRLNVDELLLREELRTGGGDLFLERYGELINLSKSGQLALRHAFETHLSRVEWGSLRLPVRFYPFLHSDGVEVRPILIDPRISFGRPVADHAFVSTRAIVERIDAGELVEDVARDYGLSALAVQEAVVYERAA